MRTLALLGALLLLAVQAQAEPLRGTADQLPTQDQPGDKDQDTAISLAGDGLFVREASGEGPANVVAASAPIRGLLRGGLECGLNTV